MCGIAGLYDWGNRLGGERALAVAHAMGRTLVHRGPDDEGSWHDAQAGIALTHRRLAVMDPTETGAQPMVSRDGRYVLITNAEIYNFKSLRAELSMLGVVFRGHSDTEVLLEAIANWGIEVALERAEGMFALACWDTRERRLHLARDRFGIKPLHWGKLGGGLVFASELKALRQHPAWSGGLDPATLDAYFRYACVPAPMTIHPGIHKLMPATHLTIDADGKLHTRTYWSVTDAAERGVQAPYPSDAAAEEEITRAIRESVRNHLVSDVPVGLFLSGGIDSATVAAMARAVHDAPIRTFCIGFDHADYDESAAAERIANHLGTDHTTFRATPDDALAAIRKMIELFDEPFADPSQIPTYLLCQRAREQVTVALSGDGGDELFGGYHRHFLTHRLADRLDGAEGSWRTGMARMLAPLATTLTVDSWDRLFKYLPGSERIGLTGRRLHKAAALHTTRDPTRLYEILHGRWPEGHAPLKPGDPSRAVDRPSPPEAIGPAGQVQFLDQLLFLPDDVLTKVDRASMAVSLEVRVPLLDHRLAALAWRLPSEMKWRDGQGKWLLRRLLSRHVPGALVARDKSGFNLPIGPWLRGPLRDWAEGLLSPTALMDSPWLEARAVRRQWERHLAGADRMDLLWPVIMLQAWRRSDHAAPGSG